jgi:heat shock protein HslJ
MYRNIFTTIIVLFLCLTTAWFLTKDDKKVSMENTATSTPVLYPAPVAFVSGESGESVFVTFGTSTALLNGSGYNNLLLTQVESASGAKYENKNENLTLWNKDVEITLTRGRKDIFIGKNEDSNTPDGASEARADSPLATSSESLIGTWLWVETVKNEVVTIPRKAGAFSVTFNEGSIDGKTDCNGFSGQYTEEGGTLSIGALAMTKMFCEESQEMEFTQQFIGKLLISYSGTLLILTHSDGAVTRFQKM